MRVSEENRFAGGGGAEFTAKVGSEIEKERGVIRYVRDTYGTVP